MDAKDLLKSASGTDHVFHINYLSFLPLFKVHCISTEFTPRKHGGEKGVPFRIQIDTFKQNESGEYTEHLHSASCQIKVFKVMPHACKHALNARKYL